MTTTNSLEHHDHHDADSTDVFGFWMYIMTDCVLFGTLFATFIVMKGNTFGGPALKHLIELPYVLGETMFLLVSNLTYGMAMLALYRRKKSLMLFWLALTLITGLGFVGMEVNEFINLYLAGHGPQTSGAMSAFYTLVGTHGLHVSVGLFWMLILIIQVFTGFNVDNNMQRRFTYLGLFWNFLDIVWIFVFTVVYLMGVL
jgi:cytochrome o ubiquinol oxidase subunit 3